MRLGRIQARIRTSRCPAPRRPPAVGASAGVGNGGRLALTLTDGQRRFEGRVHWLAPQGLSVVSDIDDTIKHTLVRQRREMLRNTFARPFVAVPGMAAWYSRLAADAPGAAFHYVSGGPLQLLPPLDAFLADGGFPAGSIHLRSFKLRLDTLFSGNATVRHKQAAITQLLTDHPERRFILVGDSGEQDPGDLRRPVAGSFKPHRRGADSRRDRRTFRRRALCHGICRRAGPRAGNCSPNRRACPRAGHDLRVRTVPGHDHGASMRRWRLR